MSLQEHLKGRLIHPDVVKNPEGHKKTLHRLDAVDDKEYSDALDKMVAIAAMADVRKKSAYAVQTWAETDDLDKDESLYDRLDALLSAIADGGIDLDGDPLTDDSNDIYMVALGAASDYLQALGADAKDVDTLFNGEGAAQDDAANRLLEFLMQVLGDDETEAEEAVNKFAFDMDSDSNVFDDANSGGTHKTVFAVRHGAKVMLRKRISGVVHRSAKQKAALVKAQAKAHKPSAVRKRIKSLRLGHKLGLYKANAGKFNGG